jgi:hypothetical protein
VLGCPATAGLGCAGVAAVVGGLTTGAGAGLGTKLGGGSAEDVRDAGLTGVSGGLFKGVTKLGGVVSKLF